MIRTSSGTRRRPEHVRLLLLVVSALLTGCKSESPDPQNETTVVFREPTPETAIFLTRPDFEWVMTDTPHFRVFVEADSFAAGRIDSIAAGAEEALNHALGILGESEYRRGTRLLVVGSRDRMGALLDIQPKGMALFEHDMVLLVHNEHIRPYLRHEIFHIVSINLWGLPPAWLREGSALYADGVCLDYDDAADTIAAYLRDSGRLIPLDRLVNHFEEEASVDDLVVYIQSGSLFGYILETYGRSAARDLWSGRQPAFSERVGMTVEQIEKDWLGHLSENAHLAESVDWDELQVRGCG